MNRYAQQTSVSPEKSRNEIEHLLTRYGGEGFAYATQAGRARIEFVLNLRRVRFDLTLPDSDDPKFYMSEKGRRRDRGSALRVYDQEVRRLWRALVLGVKAKLEMVASGVVAFEEEFLAHFVVNGRTIGEQMVPQLAAYDSGKPVLLLEAGR
jgi:hypothetical protein